MNDMQTRCIRASLGTLVAGCLTVAGWAQSPPATATNTTVKAQRILILGDSAMKGLALRLESELAKHPGTVTRSCAEIGTGLARLDLYDWHQQISELTKAFKPDTAIVWMGGNDNQPMRIEGSVVQFGQAAWNQEYSRRVGRAMDILIDGGVRRVCWMEMPDMREDKLQADVAVIRDLQAKEAKLRPEVIVLPIRNMLSPTPGKYSEYIVMDNGMPLHLRAEDGIHLKAQGYKYMATKIAPYILR